MSCDALALLSPEYIRRISPYVPGKPIDELAREYGLAESDIVKLASNENPRGPSPKVRDAIASAAAGVTRYPDGNGFALKSALAERYGVSLDQIVLGNGSNDILELATQAFLRPGDHAVYAQHAFAVEKAGFLGTGRTITQELHRETPFRKEEKQGGPQAVTLARNFVSRSK